MSSYTGYSRSNWFAVFNVAALKAWAAEIGIVVETDEVNHPGLVTLLAEADEGAWPSTREVKGEHVDFDVFDELSRFLIAGSIAVCVEVGSGNGTQREYLFGQSVAIDQSGKQIKVDLSDVYTTAARQMGVSLKNINRITPPFHGNPFQATNAPEN